MSVVNTAPNPEQETDTSTLLDIIYVLRNNLRLLLGGTVAAGLLGVGGSFLITPSFTSTAQILTPQQGSGSAAAALLGSLGGLAGAAGGLAGVKNPADQWVGMLESRTVADAIVKKFDLQNLYETDYVFQARKELADNTSIVAGKNGLITIEVTDIDPKRAQAITGTYIEELQKLSDNLAVGEASQRRLFFEKQLKQTNEALAKAEAALAQSGVSLQVLKTSPDAAVSGIAQLKAQVTAQEVKVAVMKDSLTSASPDLRQAEAELSSLRSQLQRTSNREPATGGSTEYVARYREFKYQETLFELLARQLELAKVDEAKEGAVIQVVDQPHLPEWKSKPQRALIAALSSALAAILILIYIFSRIAVNSMKKDPANAERLVKLKSLSQKKNT